MDLKAQENKLNKPQRALSRDLTNKLIFAVSMIFIVTSLFNFWLFSYKSKALYTQKASEYLSYLRDNLEVPLWNVDRDWIESICRSFANNEMVALLKVTGEDGEYLFKMVNEEEPNLIRINGQVHHKDSVIGMVELGLTTRIYKKSNYQILFGSIVQMLLVIIGLVFSTKLILTRILARPLQHLMTRIDEISAGKYGEKSISFDHFEVATILGKFNQMANKVKNRENSLIETNKQLETEIADRKEAEKALGESERRYRQLIEDLPVGIFRSSPKAEGPFLMVNPALVKMFGYQTQEEMMKKSVKNIYQDPDMRRHVLEMQSNEGAIQGLELEFKKWDGTPLDGLVISHLVKDDSGNPLYIDGIIEDITERKNLERRIQRTQQMEAIGTLAGGIAHDFNNILSSIFGFTEAAKMRYDRGDKIETHLDEILNAGLRARSLIKQILAFSRQAEVKRVAIVIGPIIKETIKFLRATLPATIEIRFDIKSLDSIVIADATQIHQIVMNLCTNSAQAMEKAGGVLSIRLDKVLLEDEFDLQYRELKPGKYVKLTVSDTGHGIPKAFLERIFEPFFTTKQRSEGTGMGLSVVHGIVKDMGGTISVVSEPENGATFLVLLPEHEGEVTELFPPSYAPEKGRGKILFVDDEEGFIISGREILEQFGYKVVTATSGYEALDLFESNPAEFDLVITDMVMPKMTGLELAERLKEILPDISIILCTGFGVNVDTKISAYVCDIVMKPVLASELADAIQGVLEKKNQ